MALEISPRDNVLQLLKALPTGDQKAVMEAFIFGSTPKKGRAPKAEGAPKRAVTADSYMHLVNAVVWPVLKAYGESLEDGDAKKAVNTVSCRTQVSSALWAPIKELESEARAEAMEAMDSATIMAAFEAWKLNPPAPHCKADKEARSVGSAGSKSSGASKKLADMTEDEKKAYYKARAAKAAATRAANKAAEAKEPVDEAPKAPEPAPAPATPPKAAAKPVSTPRAPKKVVPKEPVVEDGTAYEWKHDFGTGMTAYERVNHDGMAFLFDLTSKDYLGAYDEKANAIDASVECPFEEE
jgi:hypothetical protein